MLDIHQMHRSALAACTARRFAIKLGHHGVQVAVLGQVRAMASVSGSDQIVSAQRITDACSDRFLPDRQMNGALDLVRWIYARDLLLRAANQAQLSVDRCDV